MPKQDADEEIAPPSLEEIRQAIREGSPLRRAVEEANGAWRAFLKGCKKRGIKPAFLIESMAAKRQEPEEVRQDMRDRIRYLLAVGMPTHQADLFEGLDTSDTRRDEAEDREWDANDAGYQAGRHGQPAQNPHPPGSPLHVEWHKGWTRGQAVIAAEMGENASMAGQTVAPRLTPGLRAAPKPKAPPAPRKAAATRKGGAKAAESALAH